MIMSDLVGLQTFVGSEKDIFADKWTILDAGTSSVPSGLYRPLQHLDISSGFSLRRSTSRGCLVSRRDDVGTSHLLL